MKRMSLKMLIILFLGMIFFVGTTFSILNNSISGNGTVSLAEWSISLNQNNENNHLSIIPDPNGTTASYTLNIVSQSEVDIIYSIVIEDLPTGVSVSIDNGTFTQAINNTVTFSNFGTILYNDENKTKSHIITFKASSSAGFVNNQEVNINVIARQVLSN